MNQLIQNFALLGELTLRHLALALSAILAASPISVPIGWWANRLKRFGGMLLTALSLLHAIPSLPMFIIILVIVGIALRSNTNTVVVLALYGIAALARQVADVFVSLPTSVLEAADSLGHPLSRRFFEVELPLALPAILAGVRAVGVSTASLVTVGAFIGICSLGTLFTDGFQCGPISEVLSGFVATVAIALVLDAFLALFGWVAIPWTRSQERLEQTRKARTISEVNV